VLYFLSHICLSIAHEVYAAIIILPLTTSVRLTTIAGSTMVHHYVVHAVHHASPVIAHHADLPPLCVTINNSLNVAVFSVLI
jgi:hypothetical protein